MLLGASARRVRPAFLAVASASLLAGCLWTQPGFNAHHTGFNPHEHAITAANADSLEVDWSGPVEGLAGEVVRSRAGLLHALDGTGRITSVDPAGEFAWRATVDIDDTGLTTIAVVGDDVVVPTYDPASPSHGCLARFDAADGTPLGCAPFEAPEPSMVSPFSRVGFRAAVTGRRVVLTQDFATSTGGWAGWISTVDLGQPNRTWTEAVSTAPEVQASNPVVVGGEALVVANVNGQQSVLQHWPLTCTADPCVPTGGSPLSVWFSHAISANADGSRLAAVSNESVEVIDLATGATEWIGSLGDEAELHPTSVATWSGDALVVSASVEGELAVPDVTRVLRFAADGCGSPTCEALWTAEVEGWGSGQIAAAADVVVVGTADHPVVVLPVDCADPCPALYDLAGETYLTPPIITDGRIFTLADLGSGPSIVALRPAP